MRIEMKQMEAKKMMTLAAAAVVLAGLVVPSALAQAPVQQIAAVKPVPGWRRPEGGWSSRRVRRLGLLLLKLVAVLLVAGPVFGQQDFTGSTLVVPASGAGSNAPVTQVMTLTPVNGTTIHSVDVPLGLTGSPEFEVLSITGCVVDETTVNAAGTACKVLVRFASRGPGIRTGRLLVNSGLASVSVFGLVGTGFYATAAITPSLTSVLAGAEPASAGYSGDGDVATAAVLNGPQSMAFDAYGNVYFSDTGNNAVRMLDAFGNITTITGTGTAGYSGDNSFAFLATLNKPTYLAVDAAQKLYIADSGNNMIRRISLGPAPIITTFAGGGTSVNGIVAATAAKLSNPQGIAFDSVGNLYITDSGNQSVRKVSVATGKISTLAGTGEIGFSASPVAAASATFHGPAGIAVDTVGNVYVVDSGNHVVRELLTEARNVIVMAGTGQAGNSSDGGAATAAKLNQPGGWSAACHGRCNVDAGSVCSHRRRDDGGDYGERCDSRAGVRDERNDGDALRDADDGGSLSGGGLGGGRQRRAPGSKLYADSGEGCDYDGADELYRERQPGRADCADREGGPGDERGGDRYDHVLRRNYGHWQRQGGRDDGVLALAGMQALTGCASMPETTPAGSYTVPIQLTDGTGSGATAHSLNLNIVINP